MTDRITIQHVGRGAWRAGCGCGWQTDMYADEEPVSKAVQEHSQATGHLMPTNLAIAAKLDELRHHRADGNATTTDVIRVLEIMKTQEPPSHVQAGPVSFGDDGFTVTA